jgi:hypothetical protein
MAHVRGVHSGHARSEIFGKVELKKMNKKKKKKKKKKRRGPPPSRVIVPENKQK